jgi:type I restriction enzyme S subunit
LPKFPFSEAPGRARRLLRDGDTIWSCVRPNRRSFGLILDPETDLVASTGFAVLSPRDGNFAYLYLASTTNEFTSYLTNHARGAAYPAVTGEDFENAPILRPAESVLAQFQDLLAPILRLQEVLRRQNRNLRRTRDLLLPKLMSGELDVSTINAQPLTLTA